MKKFMVIYRTSREAIEKMHDKTPEEMKKGMEPWMAWMEKCGDALLDMGSPLGKVQIVTSSGSEQGSDDVGGYSILQAESMDDAVKMLEGHPHLGWAEGCEINVYEMKPMPK